MLSRFRPSPSMLVALAALFSSVGGSAYAISTINGSKLMNRSVAGKKLEQHTITGNEISLGKLGTVPSATVAANALALGRLRPAAYVSSLDVRFSGPSDGCSGANPGGTGYCIVRCPVGEAAISGGVESAANVTSSNPIDNGGPLSAGNVPIGWEATIYDGGASPQNLTVYAYCVKIGGARATEQPAGAGFG